MKTKLLIIILLGMIILFISSCGGLDTVTPQKPLGNIDPNVAATYSASATTAGAAITTTGAATGNPILVIVGGLLTAIGVALGSYKKENK